MKVLWVVNSILPDIAENCNIKSGIGGGWLEGISKALLIHDHVSLIVCFPYNAGCFKGAVGKIKYYAFTTKGFYKYSSQAEDCLYDILAQENPDVVHVFGTEFPHSLAAINASIRRGLLNRTVVSIQGLVSVYAKHYYADLPNNVIHKFTIRDFLKRDNILGQKKNYAKRGVFEIAAIKKTQNIIGRTDWDEACVKNINSKVNYYFCNETLRDEFYTGTWNYDKCEKHSIFLGSSSYPIKGLHCVLEIFPQILKKYPDAKIYVTGENPLKSYGLKGLIHRTYYQNYLKHLISKKGIKDSVIFLGSLSAQEMKERMLTSNVFILPSSIENSPNTLGEAMLLGIPCIAADVGGVKNLAVDKEDAIIYPFDENYMIPFYIEKIFDSVGIAESLSVSAKKKALKTHDKMVNCERLLSIYSKLMRN